eukprot:790814-Rhodomonas_salina.1
MAASARVAAWVIPRVSSCTQQLAKQSRSVLQGHWWKRPVSGGASSVLFSARPKNLSSLSPWACHSGAFFYGGAKGVLRFHSGPPEGAAESFMKGGIVLKTARVIRLDKFLLQERPSIPFSLVQKLIRTKKVRVQGSDKQWSKISSPAAVLEAGASVHVYSK